MGGVFPIFAAMRHARAKLSNDELRQIVLRSANLHERASDCGWSDGSMSVSPSLGAPGRACSGIRHAHELRVPPTQWLRSPAKAPARRVRFSARLLRFSWPSVHRNRIVTDDEFPPETMIGDVPSWAFDIYSREGRAAYAVSQTDWASARWIRAHVHSICQVALLGHVVFRIEGGVVRNRLRWELADELRRLVDFECAGLESPEAAELADFVRADIPVLDDVRAEVFAGDSGKRPDD